MAARVAILQRGRATGPADALARILTGASGRLVLAVVAGGLVSLVFFRLFQCARTRRPFARIAYVGSALANLFLAISAARVLFHFRAGGDAAGLREWGAWLVSEAWGRGGLEIGGAIAVVVGGVEMARATLGKLPPDFTAAIVARERKKWITALARGGVFAHGLVLAVAGASICRAGFEANPRALTGTGAALRTIKRGEWGTVLFALVAAGLLAYSISLLILAAHRRRRTA